MESSNEPRKPEADGADLQSVSQWLQRLTKDWWTALTPIAGALATLAAALGLPNGFAQTVAWLIAVSLAITAVIVVRSKRLRISIDRERNRRVSEFRDSRAQRTSFRGLAPFGYGDFLPGPQRRSEAAAIATQIVSNKLSFAILSGDIGAGKTSLLNAGVARSLEKEGYAVAILPTPLEAWQGGAPDKLSVEQALSLISGWIERSLDTAEKREKFVVIDQFEELFIRFRSKKDRARIGLFIRDCTTGTTPISLLCAVRRDYFVDCHDLAPSLSDPLSARNTFLLHNFSLSEAAETIRECAAQDKIELPKEMAMLLAEDLSERDEVRAAELQIVCTGLRGDFSVAHYRAAGGAQAILSRYVALVIETNRQPTIARLVLRSLCDSVGSAKAPPASIDEILHAVGSRQERQISANEIELILSQLEADRLVIAKHEAAVQKFSLIHDYLIEPIKIATQDASTRIDEATRLLRSYLADARTNPTVVIPLYKLADIRRYGPKETLKSTPATRLIRRSYIAGYGRPTLVALTIIISSIAFSGYMGKTSDWELGPEQRHLPDSLAHVSLNRITTNKGKAAIVSTGSDASVVWDANTGKELNRLGGESIAFPSQSTSRMLLRKFSGLGTLAYYLYSVDPGTSDQIKIDAPVEELTSIWVNKNIVFVEGNPDPLYLANVETATPLQPIPMKSITPEAGNTFFDGIKAIIVDSDRVLLMKEQESPPALWSISAGKALAELKKDDDGKT